jgi:hypothetical protein
MIINRICITLIGFLLSLTATSQINALSSIDNKLTRAFIAMDSADVELSSDKLVLAFKAQLETQLVNPITFDNSFDSLSTYMTIITSADKQIKFYSWDERTGGTWHSINCLAQFKSGAGKIIVQQLNTQLEDQQEESIDYTDSWIYEVHELIINDKKFYLTCGAGTHGSGFQHKIIQIFSVAADKLIKCKTCFSDTTDLVLEYPRAWKLNLGFDPMTNEITYSEFKSNRKVVLRLINGVFIRQ